MLVGWGVDVGGGVSEGTVVKVFVGGWVGGWVEGWVGVERRVAVEVSGMFAGADVVGGKEVGVAYAGGGTKVGRLFLGRLQPDRRKRMERMRKNRARFTVIFGQC